MLEQLQIRNFALIEDLRINFGEGFNVISGETGAGKSIILGALNLLLGEKADGQIVRSGCDETVVSAVFHLDDDNPLYGWLGEHGLEVEDGLLLIRRTVKANGRGMIYVQSQPMTRADLATISDALIDMSGQHDHQSLLSKERQRLVLDSFGDCGGELSDYVAAYASREALKKEYAELSRRIAAGAREEDYLRFALEEIAKVEPKPGEDEALKDEIQLISQFEHIHENLTLVHDSLKGSGSGDGALAGLHAATTAMARAAKGDPALSAYTARLESLRIECEDIQDSVRDYLSNMSYSQERLDLLQDRLSRLQRLKKKYGPSLDEVIAYAARTEESLRQTENGSEALAELERRLGRAEEALVEQGRGLSAKRRKAALLLGKEIASKLRHLGMGSVVFSIGVESCEYGPNGCDQIEFLISANPGEPLRPIREIASGGELSRIMLSIKTVLAENDDVETMVFDEVDAGIGGAVANAVGEQIQQLSRKRQVVAITHLASIAARADFQFVVAKNVEQGRTYTRITPVSDDARVHEIARMLSGDSESEVSLEHAKKLLDSD
ncbi:MAG: DNA repair protein RecN [Sphaerochaetaceae bacterium]|nr:DNA repair protein RecN [Sphaerochaetaceae bacterium]